MYKLKIQLKQHTPIIHFQHKQIGATLRATEVKPKLDRFILEKLGGGNYKEGIKKAGENKGWLIEKGKGALDYKIKFRQHQLKNAFINQIIKGERGIPFFFGNMGDDYDGKEKAFIFNPNDIECQILTFKKDLNEKLIRVIREFFLLNNFGTRQSKGFGSFTVEEIEGEEPDENNLKTKPSELYFDVEVKNLNLNAFKNAFRDTNIFYNALRAGINHTIYVKSFLFLYFIKDNINWEKRKIKIEFFSKKLKHQQKKWDDIPTSALHSKINDFKLIRDLLGLSTSDEWVGYSKKRIEKVQAEYKRGEWVEVEKEKRNIDRFKSPITFKPVLINDNNKKKLRFYIILNQKSIDYLLSKHKDFLIKNGNQKFDISMPNNFSLTNFFDFVKTIELEDIVEDKFQNSNEFIVLDNILNQLNQCQTKHTPH